MRKKEILSFVILDDSMQSEINWRKTNTIYITYMWNLDNYNLL